MTMVMIFAVLFLAGAGLRLGRRHPEAMTTTTRSGQLRSPSAQKGKRSWVMETGLRGRRFSGRRGLE